MTSLEKKVGLGLDTGGSSSRWLLLDERNNELGSGVAEPITGHVFTENEREENLGRLRGLLQAVMNVAQPDAVLGGITGLHKDTDAAATLQREVCKVLELQPNQVRLDNDMSVAYASVFAPGEGVLVYAGTGSVAYHVRRDGEVVRAGGYGYLIDDAGGGFWIGQQGLKQVLRWFDERGAPETRPLAREVYKVLGSDDWDDIIGVVYGGGRRQVAALAPAVARAAHSGDEVAKGILEGAGAELAALAQAIFTRLGEPLPVVFSGGIAQNHSVVASLEKHLPAGHLLKRVPSKPVRAAAELALELADASAKHQRGGSSPKEERT